MQKYTATITIDDEHGIVNVDCTAEYLPGKKLSFETAWDNASGDQTFTTEDTGMVIHPSHGHTVMTYDNKDEAIGEAMTSLRNCFDKDEWYRPASESS